MKYFFYLILSIIFFTSCNDSDIPASDNLDPFHPQDEMTKRQNDALLKAYIDPQPKDSPMWMYECFATACYALEKDKEKADQFIKTIASEYYPQINNTFEANAFHWHAYLLERIYWLYSSYSKYYPNRMGIEAENSILEILWDWTSKHCTKSLANPEESSWIWGSENHHLQAWVSFWGATQILKNHPNYKDKTYSDGNTPEVLWKEFTEYFKAYFKNRAQHGLMVEIEAPTYAKYSLNTIYNFVDFSEDEKLKELADNFLNVYWTEWAIEQLNGVRGGSRHRCYPGSESILKSGAEEFAWYHFGIGPTRYSLHPGNMATLTTFWRPNKIVSNLVNSHTNNGNYAYTSRNYGKKSNESVSSALGENYYKFIIENGGLLRYTWITPNFVMGMTMEEALSKDEWNNVSSQNRWNGIIFSGNYTKRIFTQPEKLSSGSVYNAEWGVQNKGVMILQRLGNGLSNAKGQAIWIEKTLPLIEKFGWLFTGSTNAFAAIKIVNGGYSKLAAEDYGEGITGEGRWLKLSDQYSPIIFEVADKKDFSSFDEFQNKIIGNQLTINSNNVIYNSSFYNTTLKLFSDYSALPQIDGNTINLYPEKLMDSPFLNSTFGSGIITISDGSESVELDFNY